MFQLNISKHFYSSIPDIITIHYIITIYDSDNNDSKYPLHTSEYIYRLTSIYSLLVLQGYTTIIITSHSV